MSRNVNARRSAGNKLRPAETRNVIIIDDSPHDRAAMEGMVRASRTPHCSTSLFSSVGEAISSGRLGDADLILLDDRLADGVSAERSLKALREAGVGCPAIVVSGVVRKRRGRTVIRHGAVQFASKEELDQTAMQRLLAYGLTARGLWSLDGS